MIDLFRERGAVPIIISPNPSTPASESLPSRLCHIEDIVNVINYVAIKKDAIYANCFDVICQYMENHGVTIEELMTQEGCESDGLHPTDRVQKIMAEHIMRTIGLTQKIPGAKW